MGHTQAWACMNAALARPEVAGWGIDCLAVGLATATAGTVRVDEVLHLQGELNEEPETLLSHCASLLALWSAMRSPTLIDLGQCACVGEPPEGPPPGAGRRFALHAGADGAGQLLFVVFSATCAWPDTDAVKRLAEQLLALAERERAAGAAPRSASTPMAAATDEAVARGQRFTARELDILRLLAEGLSNKQIARLLGTSPNTVRNQIYAVFRKTGVRNRTELALRTRSQPGAAMARVHAPRPG